MRLVSTPSTEAVEAVAAPDVRTAVRLGWAVAELRGRSWPEGSRPCHVVAATTT